MNTEDLDAMRARAELAVRQGEWSVIDIVIGQDVPDLLAEVEALRDPVGAASDTAQALIEAAGRAGDIEARSALLAASRVVDQVLMENLRLQRRVAGLSEVVDASLAVEMALLDSREAVGRVEALVGEWQKDADGVVLGADGFDGVVNLTHRGTLLDCIEDVQGALAGEPVVEGGEGGGE